MLRSLRFILLENLLLELLKTASYGFWVAKTAFYRDRRNAVPLKSLNKFKLEKSKNLRKIS